MRIKSLHFIRFTALISILLIPIMFSTACSSLNTREDYAASTRNLKQEYAHPEKALENLPVNEKGTFIDLMERTYLNLLAGNPDIDGLLNTHAKSTTR